MRLRQRDLKEYTIKRRISKQDDDGTTYEDYESQGTIKAKIHQAGGQVMSEMYGEKLKYMLTMITADDKELNEKDGICVYVNSTKEPDYKIVAIKTFSEHRIIDLEKV